MSSTVEYYSAVKNEVKMYMKLKDIEIFLSKQGGH